MHYLGIEIGGTKLQLVLGNDRAQIQHRARHKVDPQRGGPGIREQIAATIAEWRGRFQIVSVGVGFGGPIDSRTGRICCSHQIQGWDNFPLSSWLRDLTGARVAVDNDANVGALGEAVHGAGKGKDPVFYVTMGSGVGGGLVRDSQIYHGALPGEAEIGHLRLDKSGTIVESRCSGWAVDKGIREALQSSSGGALAQLVKSSPGNEARHLGPALAQGDPLATRIVDEVASDLAFALSHVTHLFHPEVIVLSGGLSLLGHPLQQAVARALPGFVMEAFHPVPEIALAALGEDAIPVGALQLAKTAF
ncbi:MAG TPA: ROK family protein [Methylomirabilota bacterium]|nr:ROK family protein [Methylomirabilota bacterium]